MGHTCAASKDMLLNVFKYLIQYNRLNLENCINNIILFLFKLYKRILLKLSLSVHTFIDVYALPFLAIVGIWCSHCRCCSAIFAAFGQHTCNKQGKQNTEKTKQNKEVAQGLMEDATAAAHWMRLWEFLLAFYLSGLFGTFALGFYFYFFYLLFCCSIILLWCMCFCWGFLVGIGMPNESIAAGHVCVRKFT